MINTHFKSKREHGNTFLLGDETKVSPAEA